jgi:hypothetical protein
MYKEIISAMILLLILYVNYLILLPKLFYRNFYVHYLCLSLLFIFLSGFAELWLVESDIGLCLRNSIPANLYKIYIHKVLLLITMRNGGFYLFFTMLGMYKNIKKNALKDKQAICKKEEVITFLGVNEQNIVINLKKIIFFQQIKNNTKIYTTYGKSHTIYASLKDIEEYLENKCLKINRNTVVPYDSIISFSVDSLLVKDYKRNGHLTLTFFKNNPLFIYSILQNTIPHKEQKNNDFSHKKDKFDESFPSKHDENKKIGRQKELILEEIKKNECISVNKLGEILQDKFSVRTLERRLKELKEAGIIEYRGSDKTGGYYIV